MARARVISMAAACGLLTALSMPAAAQYGSGEAPPPTAPPASVPSNNERTPSAAPPAATAPAGVLRAAACAVQRDANVGIALLAAAPFSAEERSRAANLVRAAQRCLRSREQIATSVINARGATAEALYETQFATAPAARSPALGAAPLGRAPASQGEVAAVLAPMYGLADCSAPRQPDLVRAVLAAEPRSPEEGAALTALHPTFAACVPPGTRLTYDPRFMRLFLAEALYRWAAVQRDGAASPWAAAPTAAAPSGQ